MDKQSEMPIHVLIECDECGNRTIITLDFHKTLVLKDFECKNCENPNPKREIIPEDEFNKLMV